MGSFNSNVWGYIISGTLIESERARIRSGGFSYEKPKTKRVGGAALCSFMFGSIGMIYVSLSSVLLMFIVNTFLFATTLAVIYITGNFAWIFLGIIIWKTCTVCLAIFITDNYNEKILGGN